MMSRETLILTELPGKIAGVTRIVFGVLLQIQCKMITRTASVTNSPYSSIYVPRHGSHWGQGENHWSWRTAVGSLQTCASRLRNQEVANFLCCRRRQGNLCIISIILAESYIIVTFSVLQCLCGTHNWYLELYMIRLLIAQGVQLYSRLSLFRLSEVRPPRYIGHLAWHGMLATVEPP